MKIAFSALFLLFFAFSTQHLILAADDVLDIDGNPVVPGMKYLILDARGQHRGRGIEVDQVGNDTCCSTTVIIGSDPKRLVLHQDDDSQGTIKLNKKTSFEFYEISHCAEPGKWWNVSIPDVKEYPVVIGPTDDIETMPGWFEIAKPHKSAEEYYINFKFFGKHDYALMISRYEKDKDFYRMVFCPSSDDKYFTFVFKPSTPPSLPPLTPSPPPRTTSPSPPSTFVPLIRKIVR